MTTRLVYVYFDLRFPIYAFFVKNDASDFVPFAALASFFAAAETGFTSALR